MGGAIHYNKNPPFTIIDNYFANNDAPYSPNIASYPFSLRLKSQD